MNRRCSASGALVAPMWRGRSRPARVALVKRHEDGVRDHETERQGLHNQFARRQPGLQTRMFGAIGPAREEAAEILMLVVALVIAQMRVMARHMLVLIGELLAERGHDDFEQKIESEFRAPLTEDETMGRFMQ